jgi:hypothetical protein
MPWGKATKIENDLQVNRKDRVLTSVRCGLARNWARQMRTGLSRYPHSAVTDLQKMSGLFG